MDDTSNKQLLFQLFVDDTSMYVETTEDNFLATREALSFYEKISGAKLNMEKSTLVPMDDQEPPT